MATNTSHFATMAEAELSAAISAPRAAPETAVAAFKELARRRSPALAEIARTKLTSARAPVALRSAAAVALGKATGDDNQAALLKVLSPTAPELIKHVAQSLGRIGDKRALAKLEAMPAPPLRSDAAAIGFAKSLIAYRLRLGIHQISPATPAKRLVPETARADRLAVNPFKPASIKAITADLQLQAPGIALTSKGALQFTCRNSQFLIMMTQAYDDARDTGDFARDSGVIALVFKQASCAEHSSYSLYEYIFVNTGHGSKAALVGVRASGETIHSGEISLDTRAAFTLEAENSLHTNPLALGGSFNRDGKMPALDAILVGRERAAAQPRPGAPAVLAPSATDRPRASA